jgi:MYXO-CTERM domain-containing protein
MKTSSILLAAAVVTAAPLANAATVKYTATINGAQEAPAVDSPAKGTADLDFDDQTRELRGTITLDPMPDTPVVNQHIHNGKCGESGSIVKNLTPPGQNGVIAIDPVMPLTLNADQAAALEAGNLYINIHSMKHPGGELRGQILKQGSPETCPKSTSDGGTGSSGAPGGDGGTAPAASEDGGCSTAPGSGNGTVLVAGIAFAVVVARRRRR